MKFDIKYAIRMTGFILLIFFEAGIFAIFLDGSFEPLYYDWIFLKIMLFACIISFILGGIKKEILERYFD